MKKIVAVSVLVACGLLAANGIAGAQSAEPVTIGSGYARGDVGYVHNTSDSNQLIGCQVYVVMGQITVECYARDQSNKYGLCFKNDADAATAQAVEAIDSDSYVEFDWDNFGRCTDILVKKDSIGVPKH